MTVGALQINVPLKEAVEPKATENSTFWGKDGFSFSDLLDMINPLQQLPIVGDIYRAYSDSEISTGSRLAGGTLFGGPLGFASALFNEILKSATGHDVGETVIALAKGEDSFQVASNDEPYMSANQRAAYNSYVSVQNLMA